MFFNKKKQGLHNRFLEKINHIDFFELHSAGKF